MLAIGNNATKIYFVKPILRPMRPRAALSAYKFRSCARPTTALDHAPRLIGTTTEVEGSLVTKSAHASIIRRRFSNRSPRR
jgi:hypothetical protein